MEVATSYASSGLYRFARVFDMARSFTNADVFASTMPIIMECLQGNDVAVIVSRTVVLHVLNVAAWRRDQLMGWLSWSSSGRLQLDQTVAARGATQFQPLARAAPHCRSSCCARRCPCVWYSEVSTSGGILGGGLQAYGQAATGKSHAMRGPVEDPGVIPRVISQLFQWQDREDIVLTYVDTHATHMR